jgi:putative ABC transport system substrate-binding protein
MTFCIRRREFMLGLGGAAVGPMVARAQRTVPLIVWLSANAASAVNYVLASFRQGLKEGGYEEGRNVEILYRYAEYQHDRLPSLAADLVRLRVAVIVAAGGAPALAAKTSTIPIVFVTGLDPIAMSFVPRENRPGGNLTGASYLSDTYYAKGIELMHELAPEASAFSFLMNPTNPLNRAVMLREMENSARTLGLRLMTLNASSPAEIDQAFSTLAQERTGGLILDTDAFIAGQGDQIVALATRFGVPVMYPTREMVRAGGLMSYGGSRAEAYRIGGGYTARILNGEKPGDLPSAIRDADRTVAQPQYRQGARPCGTHFHPPARRRGHRMRRREFHHAPRRICPKPLKYRNNSAWLTQRPIPFPIPEKAGFCRAARVLILHVAPHCVSAFAARQRLVLGQVKVAEKSNEIVAIPALLDMMAIEGAIVTIDAMGCQRLPKKS